MQFYFFSFFVEFTLSKCHAFCSKSNRQLISTAHQRTIITNRRHQCYTEFLWKSFIHKQTGSRDYVNYVFIIFYFFMVRQVTVKQQHARVKDRSTYTERCNEKNKTKQKWLHVVCCLHCFRRTNDCTREKIMFMVMRLRLRHNTAHDSVAALLSSLFTNL